MSNMTYIFVKVLFLYVQTFVRSYVIRAGIIAEFDFTKFANTTNLIKIINKIKKL